MNRRIQWVLFGCLAVALLVGLRLFPVQQWLREVLNWVGGLGWTGVVLFIALYVMATVVFVPASVLTVGAGAVYGLVWGSVYVSVASTLGATSAFLIGRYLARDAVARRIAGNKRFTAIDQAVAAGGWKIVGLTRLSPVFPFALLNYAFGLTRVSLMEYVVASWIGMMPGTVLYVSVGALAGAASRPNQRNPLEWVLVAVGILATAGVTVVVTRLARRELAKALPSGGEPTS